MATNIDKTLEPITPKLIDVDPHRVPVAVVRARFVRWCDALVQLSNNTCANALQDGDKYNALGVLLRCYQLSCNCYDDLSTPLTGCVISRYPSAYSWFGVSGRGDCPALDQFLSFVGWYCATMQPEDFYDLASAMLKHFDDNIAPELTKTRKH